MFKIYFPFVKYSFQQNEGNFNLPSKHLSINTEPSLFSSLLLSRIVVSHWGFTGGSWDLNGRKKIITRNDCTHILH